MNVEIVYNHLRLSGLLEHNGFYKSNSYHFLTFFEQFNTVCGEQYISGV